MALGDSKFIVLSKTMRDLKYVQRRLVEGGLHNLAEKVRVLRDECYQLVEAMGQAEKL